ncbi:MAG: TetR/AcrR family transcriptional regulator [Nocardioides sp.]
MPRAGLSAEVLTRSAAELADEEGLAGVTLAALARRFEVKAPSLYAHVSGNQDLKQRVAVLALAETADRVAEAVAGLSGRDALDALGRAHRDYAAAHPGRHEATTLPLDDDVARASAAPRHAALSRAVLRSYALAEPDETHAVRLLGATVRGWTDLELAGGFARSEPDAEESWQRTVDGLDELFSAWGASSRARA